MTHPTPAPFAELLEALAAVRALVQGKEDAAAVPRAELRQVLAAVDAAALPFVGATPRKSAKPHTGKAPRPDLAPPPAAPAPAPRQLTIPGAETPRPLSPRDLRARFAAAVDAGHPRVAIARGVGLADGSTFSRWTRPAGDPRRSELPPDTAERLRQWLTAHGF